MDDTNNPNHLLERALWDPFWLPPDVTVVDRPEVMILHCPRPVPYLNAVLRTRAAPDRIPELIAEVRTLHPTCSRWLVTDTFDNAPLAAALDRAGYGSVEHHEARAMQVDAFRPRARSAVTVRAVDSMARLHEQNAVADRAFNMSVQETDEALATALRLCTGPDARVTRYVAYDAEDQPIAGGSFTWFPDLRFCLLWGGGTIPEARGRGAYSALLTTRIQRARELGARYVGLYARSTTSSPIVERQGFQRWGEMMYWKWPDEGPGY